MATPLRKEIPSEEKITVRLTSYELQALEARAGVEKGERRPPGDGFSDFIRDLLGLPERARKTRTRLRT